MQPYTTRFSVTFSSIPPFCGPIDSIRIIGTAEKKIPLISFVMEGIHPHDIGTILDTEGIAVRVGQHCAQPLMDQFQVPATVRLSLALYNTTEEIDTFIEALYKVKQLFS